MPSILFVCTANQIRSPFAQALFAKKLEQAANQDGWRVESAGTWAKDGQPATNLAQSLARQRGLDLSTHKARVVTREVLAPFNLILTMEHGQREALMVEFPDLAGRIFLLSQMVGMEYEVKDPIGRGADDYLDTFDHIDEILTRGFKRICMLAANNDRE